MGKIADRFCNNIYITDDNPRNENPRLIREEIIKGIKSKNIFEISDRKIAIRDAILNLKSSEILLVAGKGHETTQIYKKKTRFFSDRDIITRSIKTKNKNLSKNIKLNIIKEVSKTKISFKKLKIRKAVINSKELKKNDIFFTIKGKKNDAHEYLHDVFKKASLVILNKFSKKQNLNRQIKVNDTLKFLTKCGRIFSG